jgi:hypothetical protein
LLILDTRASCLSIHLFCQGSLAACINVSSAAVPSVTPPSCSNLEKGLPHNLFHFSSCSNSVGIQYILLPTNVRARTFAINIPIITLSPPSILLPRPSSTLFLPPWLTYIYFGCIIVQRLRFLSAFIIFTTNYRYRSQPSCPLHPNNISNNTPSLKRYPYLALVKCFLVRSFSFRRS